MASALADLVVVVHLLFVAFAVAGGLLALRWPRALFVHLPALAWAIGIELFGGRCPLTPLENWLRLRADAGTAAGAYEGDFVAHYLIPLLYPPGWTRELGWLLAALLLCANVAIYAAVLRSIRRRRQLPEVSSPA